MKKHMMKFGFEIEMFGVLKEKKIRISTYHCSKKFYSGFRFEQDGSLIPTSPNPDYQPIEAITKILRSRKDIETVIARLQEIIPKFYINHTCGLHMHCSSSFFSEYEGRTLPSSISLVLDRRLKKEFFRRLEREPISREILENIKKNYYRQHAKKISLQNINRYCSVNTLVNHPRGFEWRSLNAVGVNDYPTLKTIMVTAYETMKSVLDCLINDLCIKGYVLLAKHNYSSEQQSRVSAWLQMMQNQQKNLQQQEALASRAMC